MVRFGFLLLSSLLPALVLASNYSLTYLNLMKGYDLTVPPGQVDGKNEKTQVIYDIDFKSLKSVSEKLMHLSVNQFEYTRWVDPRLAYENDDRFPQYLKDSRIDMTRNRYEIWLPKIDYTEANSLTNSSEVTYLYPNGTVIFYRKIATTFTCTFDFANIPNDKHECKSVAYLKNFDEEQVVIHQENKFAKVPYYGQTFILELEMQDEAVVTTSSSFHTVMSGVELNYKVQREPFFLLTLFMFPSVMFSLLAYFSFFIDKAVAPARVTLCITNILNAIFLLTSTQRYVPNVPYPTWLVNFLTMNLIFTIVPMIQYSILNSSMVTYNMYNTWIADWTKDIKASIAKEKYLNPLQKSIPMTCLAKSRKLIAKQVRSQITGGDVIQVDEFYVDMGNYMKVKKQKDEEAELQKEIQKNWSRPRKIAYAIKIRMAKEMKKVMVKKITYQKMVREALLECYRTQNGIAMNKIMFALDAKLEYSDPESIDAQVKKALTKMIMNKTFDKIANMVNERDEVQARLSPDKFKVSTPLNKKVIKEVISEFYSEDEKKIRAELWERRVGMEKKILSVLNLEHSFLYGLCETFTNNLDFMFRYLYMCFFMIAVSYQYNQLMGHYYILGICMLVSLVIIASFLSSVLSFRKKETHINLPQAIKFYIKMKCFKTKATLENYID